MHVLTQRTTLEQTIIFFTDQEASVIFLNNQDGNAGQLSTVHTCETLLL